MATVWQPMGLRRAMTYRLPISCRAASTFRAGDLLGMASLALFPHDDAAVSTAVRAQADRVHRL
jgi:hypothetical protein